MAKKRQRIAAERDQCIGNGVLRWGWERGGLGGAVVLGIVAAAWTYGG